MLRIIRILLILTSFSALAGQLPETTIAPISLAELAAKADLVALAQVRDTDYFNRRGIPVSGSAYLRILIPYKAGQADEIIEVYEKGLHEHECYFPNPDVYEEGRRYLLFLRMDPERPERYRGLAQGCAIDILVASDNSYVLRYPVSGIELSDPLGKLVQQWDFSDGYAVVGNENLLPGVRDAWLNAGLIRPFGENQWIWSMGISLSAARELIGREALEP